MFHAGGISLIDSDGNKGTASWAEQGKFAYQDFNNLDFFEYNNTLWFLIIDRENGPKPGFYRLSFESQNQKELTFDLDGPLDYVMPPLTPLTPTSYGKKTSHNMFVLEDPLTEKPRTDPKLHIGMIIAFYVPPTLGMTYGTWVGLVIENTPASEGAYGVRARSGDEAAWDAIADGTLFKRVATYAFNKDISLSYLGAPTACELFQGRLFLVKDTTIFASVSGSSLLDFSTSSSDESSFWLDCAVSDIGKIVWLAAMQKLIIGTTNSVLQLSYATQYESSVSAKNSVISKISTIGVSPIQPIHAGQNLIFTTQDNRSVMQISVADNGIAYTTTLLNRKAIHMTRSGIVSHAWRNSPNKIYWACTTDGMLVGCTLEITLEIAAWHQHRLGGEGPLVRQICVTHESVGDVLWMLISRNVGSESIWTLETLNPLPDFTDFENIDQQYLDSFAQIEHPYLIRDIAPSSGPKVTFDIDPYLSCGLSASKGLSIIFVAPPPDPDATMNQAKYSWEVSEFDGNKISYTTDSGLWPTPGEYDQIKASQLYFHLRTGNPLVVQQDLVNLYIEFAHGTKLPPLMNSIDWLVYLTSSDVNAEPTLINTPLRAIDFDNNGFFLADLDGNRIILSLGSPFYVKCFVRPLLAGEETHEYDIPSIITNHIDTNLINDSENSVNIYIHNLISIPALNGVTCRMGSISTSSSAAGNIDSGILLMKDENYPPPRKFDPPTYHVMNTSAFGAYDPLIEKNGEILVYFKKIPVTEISHLIDRTVTFLGDGEYTIKSEFVIKQSDIINGAWYPPGKKEYMSLCLGLPYLSIIETTSMEIPNLAIGDSTGLTSQFKPLIASLYCSQGGFCGPSVSHRELSFPIPYEYTSERIVDTSSTLVSETMRIPLNNDIVRYFRSVMFEITEPTSFNVLSLIGDIYFADEEL
jgi:hypothetical protein